MRKYIIGFIFGFLLAVPAVTFADGITNIGKCITAEFPVILDGKELSVKAVAFEGTSYAPVRAVGEALGLDVDFKHNQVILLTKPVKKDGGEVVGLEEQLTQVKMKIQEIDYYLDLRLDMIKPYEDEEATARMEQLAIENPEAYGPVLQERRETYERLRTEINDLYAQKSELEAQKYQIENKLEALQAAE